MEEDAQPKHKPSWFRWNWDDFIAETDHLAHVSHSAATRLMGAMWRTEDCTLPDDAKLLTRIIRGRNQARTKWDDGLKQQLTGVIEVKDGRVSSPWLTLKRSQAASILSLKWSQAPDKPLKNNRPTSPNREYRIKSQPRPALKAGTLAGRDEAFSGEQVEMPLTPEEKAERLAKYEAFKASQKREAVKQNLGITEGQLEKMVEVLMSKTEVMSKGALRMMFAEVLREPMDRDDIEWWIDGGRYSAQDAAGRCSWLRH
jgi:Protein of unknown function (DUF1376)